MARSDYRHTTRRLHQVECDERDERLHSVLSDNPSALFSQIRAAKSSSSSAKLHTLTVDEKTYVEDSVPDGFFDSLASLKSPDMSYIHSTPEYQNTLSDYENIIKICSEGNKIPPISPCDSTDILLNLKSTVSDHFSITPYHFILAGPAGHEHFWFLMNILISDVNLCTLEELNTVFACILYKGHGKMKNNSRSYRTISKCPVLARGLDKYIGKLYGEGWQEAQADTQFQGPGSSHGLAALLLTETIQHTMFTAKQPIYTIFLDAKSCFDKILFESVVREAYIAGTRDQGLLLIKNRLEKRVTFCEYDKVIMGSIDDKLGCEQGGQNSEKFYRLSAKISPNVRPGG